MTANPNSVSLPSIMIQEFYSAEISGESAFARLGELVSNDHQRRACRLLEELELVTGQALSLLMNRHSLQCDEEAARRRGERWVADYASNADWIGYWKSVIPLTEAFLGGMKFLLFKSDEIDREIVAQLVEHEEALLEFARRETASSTDSFEPLELFLAQAALAR